MGEPFTAGTLVAALALDPAVARRLFTPARLAGLAENVRVVSSEPITDFASPEWQQALGEIEVLMTGWGSPQLTAAVIERMPRLRAVVHAAGTVKGHVSDAVWEHGIRVSSATAANAIPVAEFAVSMIVLAGKNTFQLAADLRTRRAAVMPDELYPRMGNYGKRVGVVGASTIGREVIRRLSRYELEVVVFDPYLTDAAAAELGVGNVGLDELCATSDVVSLHAPAIPETRHMIGQTQFAQMRPGVTLINTARGSLVDHDALRDWLAAGDGFAVLDVTEPTVLEANDPLYELPNVLLTPHIAGSLGTELERLADAAIAEVNRLAAGLPLAHPVDRGALPYSA